MTSYPVLDEIITALGKNITVTGSISEIIWQHLISYQNDFPHSSYFDLKDGYQVVLYSKDRIPKNKKIEITGKVIKIKGPSKRLSKVNEDYSEYQILVNNWKILD